MASDLSEDLSRRGHDLSAQAGKTVNSLKGAVSGVAERAGEALSSGTDQVRRTATPGGGHEFGGPLKELRDHAQRRDHHPCRRR